MSLALRVASLLLALATGAAHAGSELRSPYRAQALSGLRGLDAREIADLRAGRGMGLARAAELNGYPGPRHVLDAIDSGDLRAAGGQRIQIDGIFERMKRDAIRVGGNILHEEELLEAAFRAGTVSDAEVRSRVARIAVLQGELRAIHLAAHNATRAILSDAQVAQYKQLRGYTDATPPQPSAHRHH